MPEVRRGRVPPLQERAEGHGGGEVPGARGPLPPVPRAGRLRRQEHRAAEELSDVTVRGRRRHREQRGHRVQQYRRDAAGEEGGGLREDELPGDGGREQDPVSHREGGGQDRQRVQHPEPDVLEAAERGEPEVLQEGGSDGGGGDGEDGGVRRELPEGDLQGGRVRGAAVRHVKGRHVGSDLRVGARAGGPQ